MAVGKTIIKQDEIQVQKLKVDNITTNVQVNNTLSLNGDKTLSIGSLTTGTVNIASMHGGSVGINLMTNGSVNIATMTNGSVNVTNMTNGTNYTTKLTKGNIHCDEIASTDASNYGKMSVHSLTSPYSYVWVADTKTLTNGDIRVCCGKGGEFKGGTITIGDISGGNVNGGSIIIGTQKSGSTLIRSIAGGSLTVSAMSGGSASIKPKDVLIVDESGGDGTYKISVAKSKFEYNRLYKIWMSNSGGSGGEWGLFAIPNNSTRQSTAYIYSGGDDDGYDDYASLDHYELAIRAKTSGNWGDHSTWDTNFQNCTQIAFVRTRIPRLDWTVDDQTSGKNAQAEFLKTKNWKIWDTGIDITSW